MSKILKQLDALETRLAHQSVDLGSALDEIRWAVTKALDADRATLYLVDHVARELVSRSVDLPGINRIRLKIGEGLAGKAAQSGRPMRMGRDDPKTAAARRMDAETGYETRTMMATPLVDKGHVIGVLQVLNKSEGDFTHTDERLLLDIAERLSALVASTSLGSMLNPSTMQPLHFQFNHIVGAAPGMRELFELITRAAATEITVLIRGESGTGKNLAAKALHDNSARRDGPLVVVDCASIPDNLIENELFGHEAGAYTGASEATGGKVGVANGGTLFLDEVGELTLSSQKKLLRLLQDKTYYPVGGDKVRHADVRFVCATNQDLEALCEQGLFRRDLLFRLMVVQLEVPPLRDRGADDLNRLIDHYVYQHARTYNRMGTHLTPEARARLHSYSWPGNVRELRHVLEAAVVLAPALALAPKDIRLPGRRLASETHHGVQGFSVREPRAVRDVVADYATWVVDQLEGNQSAAARTLGISRTTLSTYLKR